MSEKVICSRELESSEEIMPSNNECPNVLVTKTEQETLDKNYQEVKLSAQKNGKNKTMQLLEQAILKNSRAVINLKPCHLKEMIQGHFKNYYEMQKIKNRDLKREETDEKFFGDCKIHIRYAALSLDGWGLSAYGICTICLRESALQNRASLLIQNSFTFVDEYPYSPNSPYPPPGYRSTWQERYKLAVVKLFDKIDPNMDEEQLAQLILEDKKNKIADEFIEIHICGSFTTEIIESAGIISEPTDENDKTHLAVIKKKLDNKWKGMKPK
jgi:hypothetical protein